MQIGMKWDNIDETDGDNSIVLDGTQDRSEGNDQGGVGQENSTIVSVIYSTNKDLCLHETSKLEIQICYGDRSHDPYTQSIGGDCSNKSCPMRSCCRLNLNFSNN